MPKKRQQPQSINGDPTVKAATITQAGAKKVALISAVATVLVATIGGLWTWLSKSSVPIENNLLILKIIDKSTEQGIKKAKVSVEGNGGVPPTDSTDSEGVLSFPVSDLKKELRIRVEAEGYEPYNLRLIPVSNNKVQEIRLAPIKQKPDLQTSTNANSHSSIAEGSSGARSSSNKSTAITGRVEDEVGTAISDARVSVVNVNGIEVFANTNGSGYFNLSTNIQLGQPIQLRVEKKGYYTTTQGHLAGSHPATIVLKAHR